MATCMLCAFMFKTYMKTYKHARFHVFTPFSASFYTHYITIVKGLLPVSRTILLGSHEHADDDKQIPQRDEDPKVSQTLQELSYPVPDSQLLFIVVIERVRLALLPVIERQTVMVSFPDPVPPRSPLYFLSDNQHTLQSVAQPKLVIFRT